MAQGGKPEYRPHPTRHDLEAAINGESGGASGGRRMLGSAKPSAREAANARLGVERMGLYLGN